MHNRSVLLSSALAACLTLWGAAPATAAAVVAFAFAGGTYDDRNGQTNTVQDQEVSQVPGALVDAQVICVSRVGGPACLDPLPPDPNFWHSGNAAAAQASTTFGQNKVRTYGAGRRSLDSFTEYGSTGISRWDDDITYLGAQAAMVGFEVRLHGAWNDLGRFVLSIGVLREEYDDELGFHDVLYGKAIHNCTEQQFWSLPRRCASPLVPNGHPDNVYLSGFDADNVDGAVDMFVTVSASFEPGETLTFISAMRAFSGWEPGSEVDAFNTVTLTRILLQPGGSIRTGSGTSYNVEIIGGSTGVPEPNGAALCVAALAGAAWVRRRHSRRPR
jgi:hypothetical protein